MARSLALSWRQPGGFWTLAEDGERERLSLKNTVSMKELNDLSDFDLEAMKELIDVAIEHRKQFPGPEQ